MLPELIAIIERASTITERLSDQFVPVAHPNNAAIAEKRLAAWQGVIGDAAKLAQRLAISDLDLATAKNGLLPVRWQPDQPVPQWVQTLETAWYMVGHVTPAMGGTTYPFDVLLLPFVMAARQRVQIPDWLSQAATAALEDALLKTLSENSAFCFYAEFARLKAHPQAYSIFVTAYLQGEWLTFFHKYSALARLLATLTDQWIATTSEFLQRLAADWVDLQQTFDIAFAQVTGLEPALSDRHHGGRMVMALSFDTGLRLIYKPRSLGMEAVFDEVILQVNAWGFSQPLRTLRRLLRADYGWVEYVETIPAQDEAEATAYYHRAGGLLALAYALCAADLHRQNLIASGAHPVLVDLEVLLSPELRPMGELDHALDNTWETSILRTGLISAWGKTRKGQPLDIAGLGFPGNVPDFGLHWRDVNTASMDYKLVPQEQKQANWHSLQAHFTSPLTYQDHITAGFGEMYRLLSQHRDHLIHEWLPQLAQQPARLIMRHTRLYRALLEDQSRQPEMMQTGIERTLVFENLARGVFQSANAFRAALPAEIAALQQHDIPLMTYYPAHNRLYLPDGQLLEDCFAASGVANTRNQLTRLSLEDCALQIRFIQGALAARFPAQPTGIQRTAPRVSDLSLPSDDYLLEQAIKIAESIVGKGIRDKNGLRWLQLNYLPAVDQHRYEPMPYHLYDGSLGIALFLGALSRFKPEYSEPALAAVAPLQAVLAHPGKAHAIFNTYGIGGLTGFGSLVYGLTCLSLLLDEPGLLSSAQEAAKWLTPERLQQDRTFDVIGGAAGALLGLLALKPIPPLLMMDLRWHEHDPIRACAKHLLANITPEGGWAGIRNVPLAGYLHGAAGISYALLKANHRKYDANLPPAAKQAIAYENTLFSAEHQNWQDLRQRDTSFATCAICHGAAGIGLARLGSLPLLDNAQIRADIAAALQTTQRPEYLAGVDHVCCGTMGRIDFLIQAAHQLEQPELADTARCYAGWVLSQEQLAFGMDTPMEVFSFYRGLSGVGYTLLRLLDPTLPCIPLFELP